MKSTYRSFREDGHHSVRPVVDWSDTLDEKYAERELQQLLNDALDQLKPVDKSAAGPSDMEGMSDKEIAVMLGLTVSAVKTKTSSRAPVSPWKTGSPSGSFRSLRTDIGGT